MATITFGTNANNSLTALVYKPGYNSGMLAADIATINANIRRQSSNANTQQEGGGSWSATGQIILPGRRGLIQALPGDYIAVDPATGWPILVSSYAVANGPFTHS